MTKQASDRPLVHVRRVAPAAAALGRSRFGSQPLTAKRHSTQLSIAAYGRPDANKASRSHTYSCSRSSTTNNEQQYTLGPIANNPTSSGEPSRETRSARSCSFQQYIVKPRSEKWNRDKHGVRLAEHGCYANLSNLRFSDDATHRREK